MENNNYVIPVNNLVQEYLGKYPTLQEFMDAYMHNKTNLNLNEFDEVVAYYYLKEKVVIPDVIGKDLERLYFNDPNFVFGVHKMGTMEGYADHILNEGLEISNHSSSGIANSDSISALSNNIIFPDNYYSFLREISQGATYKRNGFDNGRAIIVKIPKEKMKNEFSLLLNLGSRKLLRPEYLYGYVTSKIDEKRKINFAELVTSNKRILISYDAKMKRYDELMAIVNSKEYKDYMHALQTGEAILYHPEYENIEKELQALEKEFEQIMVRERKDSTPKI